MEGNNYSQGDSDGEDDDGSEKNPAQTGQGCYKNYEHFPTRKTSALKPSQVSFEAKKKILSCLIIIVDLLLGLVRRRLESIKEIVYYIRRRGEGKIDFRPASSCSPQRDRFIASVGVDILSILRLLIDDYLTQH